MTDCELVEELLPLYLENMLGDRSLHFVKAHLVQCPNCQRLYESLSFKEKDNFEASLPPTEKEKSVSKIITGYRKWFYSIIVIAIFCSLLGGIAGTYLTMKYEELVPNHIAQDFVQYGLKGDRWVYQERVSQTLKSQVSFEKYMDIKSWEEFEGYSSKVKPAGFKISKNIQAQEYGPFDVTLKVGLVLEKGGFRVFKISIIDKAEYLKKKAALEKALENKNSPEDNEAINELDKQYINIPPADPSQGEYYVEGRILKITDHKIAIEQHFDTHSVPVESFMVTKDTVIARHHVVKDSDYYRKIELTDLKVGDVIFVIFTKENLPRVVSAF